MRQAIVTGCTGFIGNAICETFRREGTTVIGMDLGPRPEGWEGAYAQADLGDLPAALAALEKTLDDDGVPDVLVNNAGIFRPSNFLDVRPEDYALTLDVNTRATFFFSQTFAKALIAEGRGGSIVNLASISGVLGSPTVEYSTSKGAVISMTKSLGRVLAPHKIRVNAVAPGLVATPMTECLPPEQMAQQISVVPMNRQGRPEEIAQVVAFLAGDSASYMTSEIVKVHGGWFS